DLTFPFVPHVTLADDLDPARIPAALEALAGYQCSVLFDRVHLLQEGDNRRWTPFADAAFQAASVVGRGGLPLTVERSSMVDPQAATWAAAEWDAFDRLQFGGPERRQPLVLTGRRDARIVGLAVDGVRQFGDVGQDDHAVVADFHATAMAGRVHHGAVHLLDPHLADPQGADERGVAVEEGDVASLAAANDHVGLA